MTRNLPTYRLSLAKIQAIDNPFNYCPWGFKSPISALEVARALAEYKFLTPEQGQKAKCSRQKHIQRMAWFAGFGWSDPILLGNLSPNCSQVIDGKHRLRAAYVRGETAIKVQVFEAEDSPLTLDMIKRLVM